MKSALRLVLHFAIAALLTFVLASLAHSQQVLSRLMALGIDVTAPVYLSSSIDDLIGLLPGYGPVIAIAMLLGWSVGALIKRYATKVSGYIYPLTGALAMLVMHLAMYPLLNVTLIAGARGSTGLLLQCLAGLVGGYLFSRLRNKTN